MCYQLYFLLYVGSEIITIAVAYDNDSMLTQSADLGFISLPPFLTHCPILPSPHPLHSTFIFKTCQNYYFRKSYRIKQSVLKT